LRVKLASVRYLLQNGKVYGGEIWHADAHHPCALPLGCLMSIGVIVGKKM